MEKLLLKPEEVAHAIGLSRAAVYPLITGGQIPSILIGRSRRVPMEALRQWVADRAAGVPTEPRP